MVIGLSAGAWQALTSSPELNLGLAVPAEWNLRQDPTTKQWLYNEPNWEEFIHVVRGNGPVSAMRVETRRLSHEHGRWVREALAAAARGERVPMPA